jgi:hypothetical protein
MAFWVCCTISVTRAEVSSVPTGKGISEVAVESVGDLLVAERVQAESTSPIMIVTSTRAKIFLFMEVLLKTGDVIFA